MLFGTVAATVADDTAEDAKFDWFEQSKQQGTVMRAQRIIVVYYRLANSHVQTNEEVDCN